MSMCVMRTVPYRQGSRLLWGFVLVQREGLSLLWVRSPHAKRSGSLVIATENEERIFEDVANVSRFPVEEEDLAAIGERCTALGENMSAEAFRRLFQMEE
jgi:hypothetical protein